MTNGLKNLKRNDMSHSSPEGIKLSKGSNLESFSLSINKEKVLELKQQERMYSEEEVLKIIDLLFHKYASSFRVDAKEDFLLSKKK